MHNYELLGDFSQRHVSKLGQIGLQKVKIKCSKTNPGASVYLYYEYHRSYFIVV
jgi:hypothetical protein